MIRLTNRDEYGNAEIIAIGMSMPTVYDGLTFLETNALSAALNRLAKYEDTGLAPEEITAPVGWINIKDNPPETSGEYLVYDESGNIYNCEFDVAIGDNGEFGYWEAHYHPDTLGYLDSDWVQNESVTHWMPLPEPPKEVSE